MMNFGMAVRQSARHAKLSLVEKLKLQVVLTIPSYRQKLYDELLKKAIQCNVMPVSATSESTIAQDFDWDKFREFIKEWLPVILKLVLVFMV